MKKRYRYPGVGGYDSHYEDGRLFFGRENDISELMQRIQAAKITIMFGLSGCGKSSLIRAGLTSKIRSIGGELVYKDARGFFSSNSKTAPPPFELFSGGRDSVPGKDAGLHVQVLDQFEAIGITDDKQTVNRIIEQITRFFSEPLSNRRVVLVVRRNMLHVLDALAKQNPRIMENRFELRPMRVSQALRCISGPSGVKPAEQFLSPCYTYSSQAEIDIVSNSVSDGGPEADKHVDLLSLQIFCEYIERKVINRKKAGQVVTPEYYGSQKKLGEIKRNYIRKSLFKASGNWIAKLRLKSFVYYKLVGETGERRRRGADEFVAHVASPKLGVSAPQAQDALTSLCDSRVLRELSDYSGRRDIEVSHDVFAREILKVRKPTLRLFFRGAVIIAVLAALTLATYKIVLEKKVANAQIAANDEVEKVKSDAETKIANSKEELRKTLEDIRLKQMQSEKDMREDLGIAVETGQYARAEQIVGLFEDSSPENIERLFTRLHSKNRPRMQFTGAKDESRCKLPGEIADKSNILFYRRGENLILDSSSLRVTYSINDLLRGECKVLATVIGDNSLRQNRAPILSSENESAEFLLYEEYFKTEKSQLQSSNDFLGSGKILFQTDSGLLLSLHNQIYYYEPQTDQSKTDFEDSISDSTQQPDESDGQTVTGQCSRGAFPEGNFCELVTDEEIANELRFQAPTAVSIDQAGKVLVGTELGRVVELTVTASGENWHRNYVEADKRVSLESVPIVPRSITRFSSFDRVVLVKSSTFGGDEYIHAINSDGVLKIVRSNSLLSTFEGRVLNMEPTAAFAIEEGEGDDKRMVYAVTNGEYLVVGEWRPPSVAMYAPSETDDPCAGADADAGNVDAEACVDPRSVVVVPAQDASMDYLAIGAKLPAVATQKQSPLLLAGEAQGRVLPIITDDVLPQTRGNGVHRMAYSTGSGDVLLAMESGDLIQCKHRQIEAGVSSGKLAKDSCSKITLKRTLKIKKADIHDVSVFEDQVIVAGFDGHVWVFDGSSIPDQVEPIVETTSWRYSQFAAARLARWGDGLVLVVGLRGPILGKGCIAVFPVPAVEPYKLNCSVAEDHVVRIEDVNPVFKVNWLDVGDGVVGVAYNQGLQYLKLEGTAAAPTLAVLGKGDGTGVRGKSTNKYWKIKYIGKISGARIWAVINGKAVLSLWADEQSHPFFTVSIPANQNRLFRRNAILDFDVSCTDVDGCDFYFPATRRGVYKHNIKGLKLD